MSILTASRRDFLSTLSAGLAALTGRLDPTPPEMAEAIAAFDDACRSEEDADRALGHPGPGEDEDAPAERWSEASAEVEQATERLVKLMRADGQSQINHDGRLYIDASPDRWRRSFALGAEDSNLKYLVIVQDPARVAGLAGRGTAPAIDRGEDDEWRDLQGGEDEYEVDDGTSWLFPVSAGSRVGRVEARQVDALTWGSLDDADRSDWATYPIGPFLLAVRVTCLPD